MRPEHFLEHAISENVIAGNVMTRRASYMYGNLLPKDPMGQVGTGLGQATSNGEVTLIEPTDSITFTGQTMTIDGLEIEFQLTPGTEAPAEMNFLFPKYRALCMAENCTHNMHNLYTLRGAQVRDAKAWAYYVDEAIEVFDGRYDVIFASHHWPTWGADAGVDFLKKQRDMYKYLHDETLRLANQGFTMLEIPEIIRTAGRAVPRLVQPGLLRHRQPQRQGHLPALSGLFRRQPGQRCIRYRPKRPANSTWSSWAAPMRCWPKPASRSPRASIAGWRRSSITWSLPIPTTRQRAPCRPTPWSSLAIRRSPARGATSI